MTEIDVFEQPPVFACLDRPEIVILYRRGTYRKLRPGDLLFRHGQQGDAMYVVIEGGVELRFPGVKEPKKLGPGTCFGELALALPDQPRTATATATTETLLHEISAAAFKGLLDDHPRIVAKLLQHTVGYLLESERTLLEGFRQKTHELQQTLDYLRRTKEELGYQELLARTDALTGLYNRRCFDIEFERFVALAHDTGRPLALMLIDIDRFKHVNDRFGHPVGDHVLSSVADIIRGGVRKNDLSCRIGGDEFAVLALEVPPEQARDRAQDICDRVARFPLVEVGGQKVFTTVSIGAALLREAESGPQLIARSDRSLYAAKDAGGKQVLWATS